MRRSSSALSDCSGGFEAYLLGANGRGGANGDGKQVAVRRAQSGAVLGGDAIIDGSDLFCCVVRAPGTEGVDCVPYCYVEGEPVAKA